MTQRVATVGIAIGEFERAALYFDSIIPVYSLWDPSNTERNKKYDDPFGCPESILPESLQWADEVERCRQLGRTDRIEGHGWHSELSPYVLGRLPHHILSSVSRKKKRNSTAAHPLTVSRNRELYHSALLLAIDQLTKDVSRTDQRAVPVLDTDWVGLGKSQGFEVISLVSSRLIDIDTSRLSWGRVLEIRKDSTSVIALRRYRNFWQDNYEGKSKSYVEDRIGVKHYDFVEACKKHGLDNVDTATTAVLDAKTVTATLGVAFASAVANVPMGPAVMEVLAAGFAIEVGNIAIKMSKTLRNKRESLQQNDLFYLHHLQSRLR